MHLTQNAIALGKIFLTLRGNPGDEIDHVRKINNYSHRKNAFLYIHTTAEEKKKHYKTKTKEEHGFFAVYIPQIFPFAVNAKIIF